MCSFALRNPADGYLVVSQEIGGCASRAASATTSELGWHCPSPSLATYVFILNTGTSCRDWPCQLADRDPRNQVHHF